VFALARGFLAAGAQRVVASLWRVGDDATAGLIGGYFERLAESTRGGSAPDHARALQEAKRAIRRQAAWEHPFFWAGFTQSGLP
jgi:CHAT domain-containing protein